MPSSLATPLCLAFVLWLFVTDARRFGKPSRTLWVPLLWTCIIATKPISLWFGLTQDFGSKEYGEDSLLDKAVFVFLLSSAILILWRRRVSLGLVIANNRWLFVFFLYLGLSILWSDEPFVAFKRWSKDVGNIAMALIILTDEDPAESVRAFLSRCAYLLIPLTVLVIKYYPSISRKYNDWTFEASFVGMTTNKNSLGVGLCVCGLSLLWMWLALWDARRLTQEKWRGARYVVLLLMTVWLLGKAHSSTAMTCTFFGSALLLAMRSSAFKSRVGQLELYSAGLIIGVVILQACGIWDFIVKEFAELVGRDPSFHGRTKIWQALLTQPINPIFGVGYYSFWSPDRMRKLSEGYNYLLNEAHNGYLETYLNTGILGVFLLLGLLGTAANRIKKNILDGDAFGPLRLAFLASAVFYGMSEAIFNRLSILWFALLLSLLKSPTQSAQLSTVNADPSRESLASARPLVEV